MTATRWFSLRRRLLLLLLGGVAACWMATLIWGYFDAHHEIDELFDAQLTQTAQALLAQRHQLRRHEDDERDDDHDEPPLLAHPYQSRLIFQIWEGDRLLLRSPDAPATPLTTVEGFSEASDGQRHWRYFSQWDSRHRHLVQVGEDQHDRHQLIAKITLRLALPALVVLPLLAAWLWLATRRGLLPLTTVADEIAAREPNRLTPLKLATAPSEVRPLVEAINSLFGRVATAMANERRFTADAAHELRTPLAALAVQTEVARRAGSEDERQHALTQLATSLRRTTRLVDQMLTLARLDHQAVRPLVPVRVDTLAEDVCADHGSLAIDKQITLELTAQPVSITADADMLRVLLRNLIDNALRYTPAGGCVQVTVCDEELVVADNGPGVAIEERERIFDRFYRLAGQDSKGSGLGLSIVRRIAEHLGASITLADGIDGQGLRVTVRWRATALPESTAAA